MFTRTVVALTVALVSPTAAFASDTCDALSRHDAVVARPANEPTQAASLVGQMPMLLATHDTDIVGIAEDVETTTVYARDVHNVIHVSDGQTGEPLDTLYGLAGYSDAIGGGLEFHCGLLYADIPGHIATLDPTTDFVAVERSLPLAGDETVGAVAMRPSTDSILIVVTSAQGTDIRAVDVNGNVTSEGALPAGLQTTAFAIDPNTDALYGVDVDGTHVATHLDLATGDYALISIGFMPDGAAGGLALGYRPYTTIEPIPIIIGGGGGGSSDGGVIIDAGSADAGDVDAGEADAGNEDAGASDEEPDAGEPLCERPTDPGADWEPEELEAPPVCEGGCIVDDHGHGIDDVDLELEPEDVEDLPPPEIPWYQMEGLCPDYEQDLIDEFIDLFDDLDTWRTQYNDLVAEQNSLLNNSANAEARFLYNRRGGLWQAALGCYGDHLNIDGVGQAIDMEVHRKGEAWVPVPDWVEVPTELYDFVQQQLNSTLMSDGTFDEGTAAAWAAAEAAGITGECGADCQALLNDMFRRMYEDLIGRWVSENACLSEIEVAMMFDGDAALSDAEQTAAAQVIAEVEALSAQMAQLKSNMQWANDRLQELYACPCDQHVISDGVVEGRIYDKPDDDPPPEPPYDPTDDTSEHEATPDTATPATEESSEKSAGEFDGVDITEPADMLTSPFDNSSSLESF